MPSREDWIDATNEIPEDWQPDGDSLYVDVSDEELLTQRILEWVHVLKRVGGIVSCAAVRKEIAPGMFVVEGFGFKWDSYAPAERLPREEREPQRRRKPRHEHASNDDEAVAAEAARLDEPLTEEEEAAEYAAAGEEDPDGIPDDHRHSAETVLG